MRRFRRSSFAATSGMNRLFVPRDTPVSYPLHLLCGELDLPIVREAAASLHKLEAGSRLTMLQEAGHCANLDEPLAFNAAVQDFLRSLR